MTTEERLERIEANLDAATATLKLLAESQSRTQEAISDVARSISHYISSADARMTRIEENLDVLIRAITAEHRNGKSHS